MTLIFALALLLLGVRSAGALAGYAVVAFAGFVALFETYRGAKARRNNLGESWPAAALALFARNRRRYGGYIVHLGITVIGIGVIGSTLYQQETQQTLAPGDTLQLAGYTMRYDDLVHAIAEVGRSMTIANVTVSRDGNEVARLRPRQDLYPDMPMTIAGATSPFPGTDDFYVLLVGWNDSGSAVTFKVYYNPLINLVWWGGLILIIGTLVAAWKDEPAPVYARQRVSSDGKAPVAAA